MSKLFSVQPILLATARPAIAVSSPDVRVAIVVPMTTRTVGAQAVNGRSAIFMFASGYGLQVCWIYASTVTAHVVKFKSFSNFANAGNIGKTMGGNGPRCPVN